MNKLTVKQKSGLFIVAMVLVAYIAYHFSFRHAIAAIQLNHQLSAEKDKEFEVADSFPQLEKQNAFYIAALKSYQVKGGERETKIWQAVSGMAVAKNVGISYLPTAQNLSDTTAFQKHKIIQQFQFKGAYNNLIKLLDTINRTKDIGKITELELTRLEEEISKQNELKLRITIAGI
jgi:hypothetical protein